MNERAQVQRKATRTWLCRSIIVALAASLLAAAGKGPIEPRHISSGVMAVSDNNVAAFRAVDATAPTVGYGILRTRSSILIEAPVPRASNITMRADTPVSASGGACAHDIDCDDCNPCTNDGCVGGTCVHITLPDETLCDDGLFCNGVPTCQAGVCTPGPVPDCGSQICDEEAHSCIDACLADADCDDGRGCTNEHCETGRCVQDVGPCGPGGFCQEPVAPDTEPACGEGRCCDGAGGCTRETFEDCTDVVGRNWRAAGSEGTSCEDEPCPAYSSGIAPQGTFVASVGPISLAACAGLTSLGDDYTLSIASDEFLRLETFRWVGGVERAGDVVRFSWFDGNDFIEDEFVTIDQPGIAIHTFDLPRPITIPSSGFFSVGVAEAFSPEARIQWLSTDSDADVGTGDPNKMLFNGALVSGGVLGVCSGGVRDGLWCDLTGSLATCPGGVCNDIPDTLAFELIGDVASVPLGACCDAGTGVCVRKLPWICERDGGLFGGEGTFCSACSNDPFRACTTDGDCPACTGDPVTEGDACPNGNDDCGSGFCIDTASCTPVPPACSVQGCCAGSAIGTIAVCGEFSDNAGFHCPNGDIDCDGASGSCSDLADIVEGNCVTIRGGCSTLDGAGRSIPCSRVSDCPLGDTCLNNVCPVGTGTGSGNFGSSCAPSVCVQPQFVDCPGFVCERVCLNGFRAQVLCENCPGGTCNSGVCDLGTRDGLPCEDCPGGLCEDLNCVAATCVVDVCVGGGRDGLACVKHSGGDNCFDAPVVEAPVPPLPFPPTSITTTITGNNVEATYDDFIEGVCEGGKRDTLACDPSAEDQDAECPGLDATCVRLCGSDLFNPDGTTADPGWWEAFHISQCANVRVGLCGSSLSVQPAWAFLSVGCPCDTFIASAGVDPPIGTGLRGAGGSEGDPFCTLNDNTWQTFRNLPPGTYYYPIFSAPDGTCAAPIANPDAGGCTYQLQITTGACLEAACCAIAACTGGDDDGLPCEFVGLGACPDGECVAGVCDAGIMIGHACTAGTVDQCPGGTCAIGPVCTQTNALRCEAAGGFFAAELNLPEKTCSGGPHLGNACEDDLDCPESVCAVAPGAALCPGEGLGICEFGACCDGSGGCGDTGEPPDPLVVWDRQQCNLNTLGSGTFVAGSRCNYPERPCPVCELEGADFCQPLDGSVVVLSDLDDGAAQADNFVPLNTELFSICLSGSWIDSDATGTRIDCACDLDDVDNCVPRVADAFRVRIFRDLDGRPDEQIGTSGATVMARGVDRRFENFDLWNLSLLLDTPITGLSPGECHWIEVTNNTTDEPSSCNWYWSTGTADGVGAAGDGDNVPDASTPFDMAFCVDSGLGDPPGCAGPTAKCCDELDTCSVTTQADCVGGIWDPNQPDCSEGCAPFPFGGDDCATERGVIGTDSETFQNILATTDGPTPVQCESGIQEFGSDIWYEHVPVCDGVLMVSLCDGTDFDSIMAVYGDETVTCSCPTNDLTQLACDDDGCVPTGAAGAAAGTPPEPCTEPSCGKGASELCLPVTEGNCYMLRIGGVNGARGSGNVKLDCAGSVIYVNHEAGGANNGTSWTDAYTDLQDAVELAARVVACDRATLVPWIWVAGGTYKPDRGSDDPTSTFVIGDGVVMYGGFAGDESSLADRDPPAHPTTLSGQLASTNSYHVVTMGSVGADTILDGFIISDGLATGPGTDGKGGGLLIDGGNPVIANCHFVKNFADTGGAIYTTGGAPTFVNCLLTENLALVQSGAVHIQSGEPTFVNCTVAGNFTDAVGRVAGIGIGGGRPTIVNCAVSLNRNGGGSVESAQIQVAGGAPVLRYNCIEGLDTLAGGFGNVIGNNIFANPVLADYRLRAGSACIDAGDWLSVPADLSDTDGDDDTTEVLPFDLARVERFLNDGATPDSGRFALNRVVDMGAFEFEPDCNENGVRDDIDLITLASPDCNGNGVPDECEIDENTLPLGTYFCDPAIVTCDPDCDANAIPDSCVLDGCAPGSPDYPGCDDCNDNDIPDSCELEDCTTESPNYPGCADCNGNGVPDECDIRECTELSPDYPDCDDCNGNNVPDSCDIADGTSDDDVPPNGVPDECIGSESGAEGNFSDVGSWQGDSVPGPDSGATMTDADLLLDVNKTVKALRLDSDSSLDVNNADVKDPEGDLVVELGIRNEGRILLRGHRITALGIELVGDSTEGHGALDVEIGATVDLGEGVLMIEQGGFLESPGTDGVDATITAGRADIRAGDCGRESGMAIRSQMSVTTSGNFELDGQMQVHPCVMPSGPVASSSSRGGKTPPILRVASPSAMLGSEVLARRGPGEPPGLIIKGDLSILHAVTVCIGCEPAEPPEPEVATIFLEGDFENRSRYTTLFDWVQGRLRLQGPIPHPESGATTQLFEVAGVDIGPMGTCGPLAQRFLTNAGTNTEPFPNFAHTNFAIGTIAVAGGSHVTFQNAFSNSAGTGDCAEALYVDTLRLEGNAAIKIDNCRVYFNELIQDSPASTISTVGCGELVSNIPGNECLYGPITAVDGANPFSTLCADGDGPNPISCDDGGSVDFGNDIWFSYTATCTGFMSASLCDATDFDSVVSLYHDVDNRKVCGCPSSPNAPNTCANDTCGPNGEVTRGVLAGDCVLIRVGGPGGARGTGSLQIQCSPSDCISSSPPVPDQEFGEDLTMNRALAFSVGDPAVRQAIRVRIDSVTAPQLAYLVGSKWWVQPPVAFGEISDTAAPRPGSRNFRASRLGCDPHFRDWNGVCDNGNCQGGLNDGSCEDGEDAGGNAIEVCIGGTNEGAICTTDADCPGAPCATTTDCGGGIINVYGEMVVPGASYSVSVVTEGCNLNDENSFTLASLTMTTSPYGNVAGTCSSNGCTVPDTNQVSVDDALAILKKFSSALGAMRKMRADTEPSDMDFKINVTDVLQVLTAFSGLPYKFLSCQSTATVGNLCFGGPTNLQSCTSDLDCRIPLCPGAAARRESTVLP